MKSLARSGCPFLLALALIISGSAHAQTLNDLDLTGADSLSIAVKGASKGKGRADSTGTLQIDDLDNVSYSNLDGLEFDGRIDRSGKKPVLLLDPEDVGALAGEIGDVIEDAVPALAPTTVSIDASKLKTKLSGKLKDGYVFAKLSLGLAFTADTALGPIKGKLALSASNLTDQPRCTVCGASYAGTEKYSQSLKGCGSDSGTGAATLVIASDGNDDGTASFAYTDADGTVLTGTLTQDGKRIQCALDEGGRTALEASLAGIILTECNVAASVAITRETCSAKPARNGIQTSFGVNITATDGQQQQAQGKSSNKATLLP